ncbi:hypothetical protein GCM10027297_32740 [Parahaliea aestuarii]
MVEVAVAPPGTVAPSTIVTELGNNRLTTLSRAVRHFLPKQSGEKIGMRKYYASMWYAFCVAVASFFAYVNGIDAGAIIKSALIVALLFCLILFVKIMLKKRKE